MIKVIDHNQVRELRLNRPRANAIDLELLERLEEQIERALQEGCRALVLSGLPGLFSGGLDVPFLLSLDDAGLEVFFTRFFNTLETLVACPVPIVAAITGHAPAGGLVLALCCDQRVMARGDFKIGLNEVRVGIPMPSTVLALAAHAVGGRAAERMSVSGDLMDPETALDLGLVDEIADGEAVIERAVELAAKVIRAPELALRMTREAARKSLVEQVRSYRELDPDRLLSAWRDPGTQAALAELMARIS